MAEITVADLEAMCQVIDEAIEASDKTDFELAMRMKNVANLLKTKVVTYIGLLETQQISLLDGQPKQVGGSVFTTKNEGKQRPNQSKLKSLVFGFIIHDPKTGAKRSKLTIREAVDHTIELMYKLYVSPSQLPKAAGLKEMGMQLSDFCDWETTGRSLVEIKVDEDHG